MDKATKVRVQRIIDLEATVLYSLYTSRETSVREVLRTMTSSDDVHIGSQEEILVIRVHHG